MRGDHRKGCSGCSKDTWYYGEYYFSDSGNYFKRGWGSTVHKLCLGCMKAFMKGTLNVDDEDEYDYYDDDEEEEF